MRVAALFSGGKDSVFSVYITQQYGWEVSHLVSLYPKKSDSWMFHSVNIHQTNLLAKTMNIPLVTKETTAEKETELEDLTAALQELEIDGVVSGAIASEYQRTRIERVCDRLGIKSFTPLWHKNQERLLRDQVQAGFHILIVGVFADGFDDTWLGRVIDQETIDDLVSLHQRHRINIAGEGGEYETLVVSGPSFFQHLIIDSSEKIWNRDSGVFLVKSAHLQDV
jgi:diphthine-ammonia ligase